MAGVGCVYLSAYKPLTRVCVGARIAYNRAKTLHTLHQHTTKQGF